MAGELPDAPWAAAPALPDAPWAAADAPSVTGDVLKSGGIGLVKGVIGTAGLPGDASELMAKAVNAGSKALGYEIPQEAVSKVAKFLPLLGTPTSQQLRGATESMTGPLYEPKTTAGHFAEKIGEYGTALLTPGGIARKVASTVVPAVFDEAAGQLTKGTAAEPYARAASAITGAVLTHKVATPSAIADAIPTAEQLKAASRAAYRHPEVAAIEIKPPALASHADDIVTKLNGDGFRPIGAPQTYALIDELKTVPGATAKIADIDNVRSALRSVSAEVDAIGRPTRDAVAAGKAVRQIDGFVTSLKQPDLIAGDAQKASAILTDARRDWGAGSRAEDLGFRLTRGERQAARSGTGSNIDNTIRQKVSAILDVPSRSVGYSAAEKEAADALVRGSTTANVMRKIGKLGFNDGLSLILHSLAAVPTMGLSTVVGGFGTLARKGAEKMTKSAAANLEEMLRSRSAEAEKWAAMQARINAAQPAQLGYSDAGLLSGLLSSGANQPTSIGQR